MLSRHGQTVWHAENRYAGSSDVDLDERGWQQAQLLADWATAAEPAAVVSSPLRRALETAELSAKALGNAVVVRGALREVHFGVAEGRTLSELSDDDASLVDRFRQDPVTHHFPDGEPSAAAAQRGARALRELAADYEGATVLVVAHSTLLRLALCTLLGIDVHRYREVFPRLDNGALTELVLPACDDGPGGLLSLNVPLPVAPP